MDTPGSTIPPKPKAKASDAKPKRPLSAYNLFYRFKRAKFIEMNGRGDVSEDALHRLIAAPAGLEGYNLAHIMLTPLQEWELREKIIRSAMYQNIGPKDNSKRVHRKSHGVGFLHMNKLILDSWKVIDTCARRIFEDLAEEGRRMYKTRMVEFKVETQLKKIMTSSTSSSASAKATEAKCKQLLSVQNPTSNNKMAELLSVQNPASNNKMAKELSGRLPFPLNTNIGRGFVQQQGAATFNLKTERDAITAKPPMGPMKPHPRLYDEMAKIPKDIILQKMTQANMIRYPAAPSAAKFDPPPRQTSLHAPHPSEVVEALCMVGETPKPKRPLTAYNLFYRFKRSTILQTNSRVDIAWRLAAPPGLEDHPLIAGTMSSERVEKFRRDQIRRALLENLLPKENKRADRNFHQAITFQEMNDIISTRWKTIDRFSKRVFEELAEEGRGINTKRPADFEEGNQSFSKKMKTSGSFGIPLRSNCQAADDKEAIGRLVYESSQIAKFMKIVAENVASKPNI